MEMKKFLLVALSLALLLGIAESFDFHEKELLTEDSLWELYERWRSHHTVSRRLKEKHKRFDVFKTNVMHIHNANKKDKPYKLKLNKFADMTNDEFKALYTGSKIKHHRMFRGPKRGTGTFSYDKVDPVPASVDWRKKGAVTPAMSIDGHENVPENDEKALLKEVANQPVAVAIDAGSTNFQFTRRRGAFPGGCGKELNHGVVIVGYGTPLDGTKYWIVRNSWGPEWIEKGYIRMQRDVPDKEGLCGIAMDASYPIKNSSTNPVRPQFSPKDEL